MKTAVLLVEDDPDISTLYVTRLEAAGYTVTHLSNGEDVIPYTKTAEVQPQVILMDLMLPGMNGFDVIRALRQTNWKNIPIIVLTAFADPIRQEEAKKMGIDSYFLKTEISPKELVALIAEKAKQSTKH